MELFGYEKFNPKKREAKFLFSEFCVHKDPTFLFVFEQSKKINIAFEKAEKREKHKIVQFITLLRGETD